MADATVTHGGLGGGGVEGELILKVNVFLQYINSTFYEQNTFFLHINKYADDALVYPTFSVASAKQQKHDKRGRG